MLCYQDCVDMVDLRQEDLRQMPESATLQDLLTMQEYYRTRRTAADRHGAERSRCEDRREAAGSTKPA